MSNTKTTPANLSDLEKKAADGDKDAVINLAILYELGLGDVPQDNKKAMECWKKASTSGSGLADLSIAKLLAQGVDGGDKDMAQKYRDKAAENGFMDPALKLLIAKDESGKIKVFEHTKGKRILVADSKKTLVKDMDLILKQFGFEMKFTENGLEAFRMIEKDPRIELLITEIDLNGLDGLALIEKLKSHKELYRIPIIVITNDGSKESVLKGKSFGVAAWLLKPSNSDLIQKLVSKLMPAHKKPAA